MANYDTLKKLYDDIDGQEDIFLKRHKLTPCEVWEIKLIFNDIAKGQTTTTICGNIATLFKKYRFTVTPEGIGWRIS